MKPRFSPEQLQEALRAAGFGLWALDIEENRVQWSPEAEAMAGLEPGSFDGSYESFMKLVPEEDREMVARNIQGIVGKPNEVQVVEHRIVRPDGEVRWMRAQGRTVIREDGEISGVLGTVSDVTEQRLAADQLRESERRLRLFSELVTDYMYVVDMREPNLFPKLVAGSLERTVGYTPEEVKELGGWLQLMHPDDRISTEHLIEILRRGQPFVSEYRIYSKSGEVRWLRDRVRPILGDDDQLIQVVGGVQDITDRKQLEDQLAASQRMEALARMAGGVAHDFNNLLTVMFSSATVLGRNVEPGSAKQRAVDDLRHVIERGTRLTRSLLSFGRRQVAAPEVVAIRELLWRIEPVLERAVGDGVELSIGQDCSRRLWIDAGQLELALLNLCLNARDAMPEGGQLSISCRDVDLAADDGRRPAELAPGPYVVIEVRDTGTGIAPEDLAHVFEPFFSTKEEGRGTGLGLATVYGIVREARGIVEVSSVPDQGTTFAVYLPPTERSSDGERPPVPARHVVGGSETVLVVEDEGVVRRQVERILDELGYRIVSAASAEQALELSDEVLQSVDLLLTDVRLPGKAGPALAGELQARKPGLEVLVVSGFVSEADRRDLELARLAFLPKPFTPEGLARKLREVLEGDDPPA